MNRLASLVVLLLIAAVIGMLSFLVLWSFVLPIFLAAMTAVLFRPLHLRLTTTFRGRNHAAAAVTTVIVFLGVLLPTLAMGLVAASEAASLVKMLDRADLSRKIASLQNRLSLGPPPTEVLEALDTLQRTLDEIVELPYAAGPREARTARYGELRRQLSTIGETIETRLALTPLPAAPAGAGDAPAAQPENEPTTQLRAKWDQWKIVTGGTQPLPDDDDFERVWLPAGAALEAFRVELFGGPIAAWFKRNIHVEPEAIKRQLEQVRGHLGTLALGTTTFLGSLLMQFLVGLAIMLVSLYYFLADGRKLTDSALDVALIDRRHSQRLLLEFSNLTRAIVWSMLLAAVAQGLLAGIAYYFAGLKSVFLLTLLTGVLSMLPFVGSAVVWVPVVVWLLAVEQRVGAGVGLAIYMTVVVGMADNLIKPLVLNERSNLHPLVALLSILGGVQALGPIGVVVGPMVLALLHTLLVMLRTELTNLERRPV